MKQILSIIIQATTEQDNYQIRLDEISFIRIDMWQFNTCYKLFSTPWLFLQQSVIWLIYS